MIRIVCDGVEHTFSALPVTIGRDADNDLQVDDANLSRQHCRICRTREGILLARGSSSRTWTAATAPMSTAPARRGTFSPPGTPS
jgi:predicted component of type VI protein secretion system